MKNLDINLLKCVEDLYVENYKIQMKEKKKIKKKRKDSLCPCIVRLNTFMMSILPNLFFTSITIPMNIQENSSQILAS